MSETVGSEATSSKGSDQDAPEERHGNGAAEFAQDGEAEMEVEVEEIAAPPPAGFQAFLQHANLHNLLQIESLSRTSGVFLVASQGRTGYLHLSNGELVHAESGGLIGEAAAAEILSWDDGEFKSCSRPLAGVTTIQSSMQSLLLRLAKASDEAAHSERMRGAGGAPRPIEEDKPTEPHLPAPQAAMLAESSQRPSSPPRASRVPPPLPPRTAREGGSITEVTISATGEIVQSRGVGAEEFSARVAYAARLADLIGRAIRSGTPRALELRGKGTQTQIKWQPDGALSASLEQVQSGKR